MVVLAAILIASPVLAAGSSRTMEVAKQGPKKRQKQTRISMTGTITWLNSDDTLIDFLVQKTNKPFIAYRGQTVSVDTSEALCILWSKPGKSERKPCSEILADGKKVSIIAVVNRTDWTFKARRVQYKQPRIKIQ